MQKDPSSPAPMDTMSRISTLVLASAVALATAACSSSSSGPTEGAEGEFCRPDNTCDEGLTCQGGICFKGVKLGDSLKSRDAGCGEAGCALTAPDFDPDVGTDDGGSTGGDLDAGGDGGASGDGACDENDPSCGGGGDGGQGGPPRCDTPGAVCDDGDLCTHTDTCSAEGICAGTAITCDSDPAACGLKRSCNGTASCTEAFPDVSVACDDGIACTNGDHCDGAGGCIPLGSDACPKGTCTIRSYCGDVDIVQPAQTQHACQAACDAQAANPEVQCSYEGTVLRERTLASPRDCCPFKYSSKSFGRVPSGWTSGRWQEGHNNKLQVWCQDGRVRWGKDNDDDGWSYGYLP